MLNKSIFKNVMYCTLGLLSLLSFQTRDNTIQKALFQIAASDSTLPSIMGPFEGQASCFKNTYIGSVNSKIIRKLIKKKNKIDIGDSLFLSLKINLTNGLNSIILHTFNANKFYSVGFVFDKDRYDFFMVKNYECECKITSESTYCAFGKKVITGWMGLAANTDTSAGLTIREYKPA